MLLSVLLAPVSAMAQQITGTPGAPSATMAIDGKQLPPPPSKFGGKIERNAAQSTPYWPPRVEPPKGAPNVLLIMTDDAGFGVPSTFGGVIPTPTLDRVAANGLRYTNFHSTALCSPTRAALITGRNHHSVGFGQIAEMATGFPGYDSIITRDKATIGRILKDNGYRTSWFGKDHNTWSGELTGTPNGDAPFILNSSYHFKAEVEIPEGGADGMIVTQGGRFGGYGFYLLKGKPVFLWNLVDLKRIRWEGPESVPPGKHTVEFDFKYDGLGMGTLAFNNLSGIGRGGTGVLTVDGKEVARQTMERTLPLILQWDENFDVGADTETPVDDQDYQVPFRFTGTLDKLTLTIDRPTLTPEDEKRLMEAQRNNKASE
jgi:hypothetical protein